MGCVQADIKTKGERHVLNQKQSEQLRQTQELEALELERKSQIEQLEKLRKYKVYLERTVERDERRPSLETLWVSRSLARLGGTRDASRRATYERARFSPKHTPTTKKVALEETREKNSARLSGQTRS